MLAWLGCSAALGNEPAAAPEAGPQGFIQAWLGALDTDDGWSLDQPGSEEPLVGGLGTLPFGGGAVQRLWGQGRWHFGYESGGLTSWKNDDTEFFGASSGEGGTLVVTTDNTFFAVGVFMGGILSLDLPRHVRLQVAAGPSLTWARLDGPNDDDELEPQAAVVVGTDDAGYDVSLTPYGRVGLEVLLGNGLTVGVSARYADDEFDFGGNGELDVDEWVWLLTIGSHL